MHRQIEFFLFFIKTNFLIAITTAIINLFVNVGNGLSYWFFMASLLLGIIYLIVYYNNKVITLSAFVVYLTEVIMSGDEIILEDLKKIFQQVKREQMK